MKVGHLINILQSHNFDVEVLVAGEEALRVPGEAKLAQDETTKTFRLVLATSALPDPAAGADAGADAAPPAADEGGGGTDGESE